MRRRRRLRALGGHGAASRQTRVCDETAANGADYFILRRVVSAARLTLSSLSSSSSSPLLHRCSQAPRSRLTPFLASDFRVPARRMIPLVLVRALFKPFSLHTALIAFISALVSSTLSASFVSCTFNSIRRHVLAFFDLPFFFFCWPLAAYHKTRARDLPPPDFLRPHACILVLGGIGVRAQTGLEKHTLNFNVRMIIIRLIFDVRDVLV